MGILSSTVISRSSLYAQHRIEARLQELSQKLIDIQEYAAAIANSSTSLDTMANVPASMFGRLTRFTANADAVATQNAQSKYWFMQQTQGAIPNFNGDVQSQQLYNWQLQNSLFENERKTLVDAETKKLHAEETKIEAEKAQLKTRLDLLEKQQKEENDRYDKGLQSFFAKG